MVDFVEWDTTLAAQWIDRTGPRVTVAQHNSAIVLAASVLDILAQPQVIAPPGSSGVMYPRVRYRGPIQDADGRDVPLVGSLDVPRDAMTDGDGNSALERVKGWEALAEALRLVSLVDYQESPGSAPAGELLGDVYPHGVVGVAGPASDALILTIEPSSYVQEPSVASDLATVLKVTSTMARDVAAASRANQDTNAAAIAAVSSIMQQTAGGESFAARTTAHVTSYRTHARRMRNIAWGVAGTFLAGTAIAAAVAKRRKDHWKPALLTAGR